MLFLIDDYLRFAVEEHFLIMEDLLQEFEALSKDRILQFRAGLVVSFNRHKDREGIP